ncbi:hypothetical protein AREALGSMS7_01855 [Arenibacter algicola]|uniref:Uncharacterized protein n=1 Tax=Arenibacter algicola TaxID=616991 RepID=A0A221UV98_9FLAO|nr:hypothetical protein AREALGSMS7_01855 [Arenibacter algicola]
MELRTDIFGFCFNSTVKRPYNGKQWLEQLITIFVYVLCAQLI